MLEGCEDLGTEPSLYDSFSSPKLNFKLTREGIDMGSKQRRIFEELRQQGTSTSHSNDLEPDVFGHDHDHPVDDHLTDNAPLEHVADAVFDAIYEP